MEFDEKALNEIVLKGIAKNRGIKTADNMLKKMQEAANKLKPAGKVKYGGNL